MSVVCTSLCVCSALLLATRHYGVKFSLSRASLCLERVYNIDCTYHILLHLERLHCYPEASILVPGLSYFTCIVQ